MNVLTKPAFRQESMRIAGKLVTTDEVIEVLNPYNNEVVGTVPAGRPEHVREAFAKARAFRPQLTRFERVNESFRRQRRCCVIARRISPG